MKIKRIGRFLSHLGVACLVVQALPALAQNYPQRPITLVVPFGAGSGTDQTARSLARAVTDQIPGATLVVENRGGANGSLAAQHVARAASDGYTVFITTNTTQVANPVLYKQLPYDPVTDFAPVTALAKGAMMAVVPANSPYRSISDIVQAAKDQPGRLSFASGSSSSRMAGELFQQMASIDLLHVPYQNNPQGLTDLMGGQVDLMFADTPTALPLIQSGKVKALAYTSAKRSTALPDVPTMREQGIEGYESTYWLAVYVPRNTPEATVALLNEAFINATRSELIQECFARMDYETFTSTPAGLADFQQVEAAKWQQTARAAGIQPE